MFDASVFVQIWRYNEPTYGVSVQQQQWCLRSEQGFQLPKKKTARSSDFNFVQQKRDEKSEWLQYQCSAE